MKIDLNFSNQNKEFLLKQYIDKKYVNHEYMVASLANEYNIPCIIIAYWLGELLNYPDCLKNKKDQLIKDYEYTEILNKPINCPW